MELENEKGIFNLGSDKISVERTNPLLNDQGSLSLTYPIPRTKTNDYLLGFPSHFERRKKYDIKTDVNIRAGLLNENATLQMTSVDNDKIEATFLLYESTFYAKIKEIKLPQVFEGVERWFDSSSTPVSTRVANIVSLFESIMTSVDSADLNRDFTIFPVCCDPELSPRVGTFESSQATIKIQNLINGISYYFEGGIQKIRMKAKTAHTYKDDDNNDITLPIGFGVSPFLRYGYVLRKVFEYFGFTLENNLFDTNGLYRRVTVVNNTQDAIMKGYLIESQLVPDITINDFLDFVREGMNADFFIDVPGKTARIVFLNEVINETPDIDLTAYLKEEPRIEFASASQVRLSIGKSLNLATTAFDTKEEFLKKYPDYNEGQFAGFGDIYPEFGLNSIYKRSDWSNENDTHKLDLLSSMNFDQYSPGEDIESEDHKAGFESPVSIVADDGVAALSSDPINGSYIVLDEFRRLNSYVVLNGVKQTEDQSECPFILSISRFDTYKLVRFGIQTEKTVTPIIPGLPQQPYDISLLTWDEKGLFAKFWQQYDQLLRKSWHTVTAQCRIPAKVLQSWDFTRLKLIHGQPMVANSLKYELSDDPVIDVEVELKTVKIYEDE